MCFSSVSAAVELEYSLDLGLTWQPVVRDCLPTSPDCSSYTLQRLLVSDTYNKWGRVTLPIPSYARSALLSLYTQTGKYVWLITHFVCLLEFESGIIKVAAWCSCPLQTHSNCNEMLTLIVRSHVNIWLNSPALIHVFRSPATRFRWFQQAPFDKQQTWALDNLYIGDGCPDMCSGHGRCQQSSCV